MKIFSKLLLSAFLLIALACFPFAAYAAEGTLGSEAPAITAAYTDSEGNIADGNALSAGTYNMTLKLSGMQTLSEAEFTATYDTSIIAVSNSGYTVLSDENAEIESMGEVVSNGNFVIGFVSVNDNCTQIDAKKTELISVDITVTSDTPVDMEDVMTVSQNPDFTFLEADYGDIKDAESTAVYDCYALGTGEEYAGAVYPMTCDLSPEDPFEYNVSGNVVVMLNPKDPDNTANANGLADVDIVIDDEVVATTDDTGAYSFDIANGTYTATLVYAHGLDRTVTIIVNGADIAAQPITMVLCDYDKSSTINVTDSTYFNTAFKGRNLVMGDLNRDKVVDVSDSTIFNAFFRRNNLSDIYSDIEIKN